MLKHITKRRNVTENLSIISKGHNAQIFSWHFPEECIYAILLHAFCIRYCFYFQSTAAGNDPVCHIHVHLHEQSRTTSIYSHQKTQ